MTRRSHLGEDSVLPRCVRSERAIRLLALRGEDGGRVGTDLSLWPTEKHFTAWLGVAPGSHQSGKRKGSVGRKRNRAGRLFCVMARSLARSKHVALGGFYRRMAGRRGGLVANVALARKLAEWFWRVMVKGVSYVEQGLAQCPVVVMEDKPAQREHRLRGVTKQYVYRRP
jgi:transposase